MHVRQKRERFERVALALSACLTLERVAAAESAEPESIHIEYVAPAGCPDATMFLRMLRQRTNQFRRITTDEQARKFLVRVTALGSSFSGRLEIRNPDGSSASRGLEAPLCAEVSNALALIMALAIDPNALVSSPEVDANGHAESAPVPPAEPRRQGPPASVAGEPSGPSPAPSVLSTAGQPAPQVQIPSRSWRWSAGIMGHATLGLSPAPGYGGDLFADAEAPASSVLGSAIRLGIFLNRSEVELPTGPGASFEWVAAMLEGCPVRVRLTDSSLAVHPCLALRAGVLQGEGHRLSQPMQRFSLWTDASAVLRLRFSWTERLMFEAQGSLLLPLHRPTFQIVDMGNVTPVYSVPSVGGSVGVGWAYAFR